MDIIGPEEGADGHTPPVISHHHQAQREEVTQTDKVSMSNYSDYQ